jgi:hypothetical protein
VAFSSRKSHLAHSLLGHVHSVFALRVDQTQTILPYARWQELQGIPKEDHGQYWRDYNGNGGNWERKSDMEDLR